MNWTKLNKEKIQSDFEINGYESATSTAWKAYDTDSQKRIRKLQSVEALRNNPNLLIDEFQMFDTTQKECLLPVIKTWLEKSENEHELDSPKELRDFIYEMF